MAIASMFPALWRIVVAVAAGASMTGCSGSSAFGLSEPSEDRCTSCHLSDYRRAAPEHVRVKPATCSICHTQKRWRPSVLQHDLWALRGKHASANCFDCHKGEPVVFRAATRDCIGCHTAEVEQKNAKARWHAHFQKTCGDCHEAAAWKPAASEPGYTEPPHTLAATPTTPNPTTPTPQPTVKATQKPSVKIAPKAPIAHPSHSAAVPEPISGASRRATNSK